MSNQEDKLKILADNTNDYVRALITKNKQIANAKGHILSEPIVETGGFHSPNAGVAYIFKNYHLICTKCTYSLIIEHMRLEGDEDKIVITHDDGKGIMICGQ